MGDEERWEKEKEKQQSFLKREFAEELEGKKVSDEEAERIICAELKDEDKEEYLVDGAVLACTKATWDNFPLSDGDIEIDGVGEKRKQGEPTEYLRAFENPIAVNNLRYATVADTKQGWNIMPFPCNCKEPVDLEKESILRENKVDCQSHGVCKYLMDLEEEWENCDFKESLALSFPLPIVGQGPFVEHAPVLMPLSVPYKDFTDQEADSEFGDMTMSEIRSKKALHSQKGVTMTSILFCKHGGFIYPKTSGQTVLLGNLLGKLSEKQFTGKQYMALYEIRDYMTRYPELCTGKAIFVFEGLATDAPTEGDVKNPEDEFNWNGINKSHPNGQFGAIVIVTEDGVPTIALMKASTLPDNMEKAAICEGVYEVSSVAHGKHYKGGYAALTLMHDQKIPAYNSINHDDTASFIHFHMAGKIVSNNPASPYSEGCITIPVREYVKFGKEVGFITQNTDDDIGNKNNYGDAREGLLFGDHSQDFNGYMVIDRQYYDDEGKYLKFNGPRSEE